jgi:multidrug efflux pump subunit AcrA (membrane-fusion protein)
LASESSLIPAVLAIPTPVAHTLHLRPRPFQALVRRSHQSLTVTHAADEFAVSVAQQQALGITLLRLEQRIEIRGLTYPARVALPPQQEYVVSAPVAGAVDRVLLLEHDALRVGQPLLRLNSPEFGELQLTTLEAAQSALEARVQALRSRYRLLVDAHRIWGLLPAETQCI